MLDFEWSPKVINQIADSYPYVDIQLPFSPSLLSVSGGNNDILLVFGHNSVNNLCGEIYLVSQILANNFNPISVLDFSPFNGGKKIKQVSWHPEFADTLFAAVTENGSLICIGIDYQTKGVQILSHYNEYNKMTCLSWSPKGKQLVIGFENGELIQYKHQNGKNFSKAKSINPPILGYSCSSVHWAHSSLFQVAHVNTSNGESSPDSKIIFIFAPPKAKPEFFDFSSICMDSKPYSPPDPYMINFLSLGNVVLCSTSHSSEVGVVATESKEINPQPTAWAQWILDDSARIELQPGKDDKEAVPCGLAWFRGPTKQFRQSETSVIGGNNVPLILILSSTGVLCPYYAIHAHDRLHFIEPLQLQHLPINLAPPQQISRQNPPAQRQPLQPSVPTSLPQNITAPHIAALPKVQPQPVTTHENFTKPPPQYQPQGMPPGIVQQQPPPPNYGAENEKVYQLNAEMQAQRQIQQQQAQHVQQQQAQQIQQQKAEQQAKINKEEQLRREQESMAEAIIVAINDEIKEFVADLEKARQKFKKSLNLQIGHPNEIKALQSRTQALADSLRTLAEINKQLDIETLNGFLLETFAMAQDAKTRVDRENDYVYALLNSKRSLDPITARKMREIRKLAKDVEVQLEDTNKVLDQEWDDHTFDALSVKKNKTSSIDLIYQTLSFNHKTIDSLQKKVKMIEKIKPHIKEAPNMELSQHQREIQEMIESLNSSLLSEDLSFQESKNLMRRSTGASELTQEKKKKLLDFLEQRTYVPIRRAILPVDVKSSKMVSAVVRAQDKIAEIKAKTLQEISRKQIEYSNVTPEKSQSQSTPVSDNKSPFYSTALQDFSMAKFSLAESPIYTKSPGARQVPQDHTRLIAKPKVNDTPTSTKVANTKDGKKCEVLTKEGKDLSTSFDVSASNFSIDPSSFDRSSTFVLPSPDSGDSDTFTEESYFDKGSSSLWKTKITEKGVSGDESTKQPAISFSGLSFETKTRIESSQDKTHVVAKDFPPVKEKTEQSLAIKSPVSVVSEPSASINAQVSNQSTLFTLSTSVKSPTTTASFSPSFSASLAQPQTNSIFGNQSQGTTKPVMSWQDAGKNQPTFGGVANFGQPLTNTSQSGGLAGLFKLSTGLSPTTTSALAISPPTTSASAISAATTSTTTTSATVTSPTTTAATTSSLVNTSPSDVKSIFTQAQSMPTFSSLTFTSSSSPLASPTPSVSTKSSSTLSPFSATFSTTQPQNNSSLFGNQSQAATQPKSWLDASKGAPAFGGMPSFGQPLGNSPQSGSTGVFGNSPTATSSASTDVKPIFTQAQSMPSFSSFNFSSNASSNASPLPLAFSSPTQSSSVSSSTERSISSSNIFGSQKSWFNTAQQQPAFGQSAIFGSPTFQQSTWSAAASPLAQPQQQPAFAAASNLPSFNQLAAQSNPNSFSIPDDNSFRVGRY